MSAKYIETLTPLRGIAAVWVLCFHMDVSLFYRDMGALLPRDQTGILSQGYLWVDFFFILSGFILAHVYGGYLSGPGKLKRLGQFMWARLARLYPLHLFCLGLVIVIAILYPLLIPQVKDGSWDSFMAGTAILPNLVLTHAMNQTKYLSWDIVSWSIGAEWWTSILAIPLLIYLHRAPPWIGLAIGVLSFGALSALVYALPAKNLDLTYDFGFERCLCEFIIGVSIYTVYTASWSQVFRYDLISFGLMLSIAALFHFRANDLAIVPVFALLILSASLNSGLFRTCMLTGPFQYLGRLSYSIYLVHGVVFSAFWFLLPWLKLSYHLKGFSITQKLVYVIVFITLVMAISHLTYHYIERPVRQFMLRLRGSKMIRLST